MADILQLLIPAFAGALGTVLLLLTFPDIRRARVGREEAESDSIQLGAIGEVLLSMTQNLAATSAMVQVNATAYAEALKKSADSSMELLAWMREREIQMSEERHILITRIEELSAVIKRLTDEKSQLEETLEAASLEITNINAKRARERDECAEKLTKVKSERDKLLGDREKLVNQFIEKIVKPLDEPITPVETAILPSLDNPVLTADTLQTHILVEIEETHENLKPDPSPIPDAGIG